MTMRKFGRILVRMGRLLSFPKKCTEGLYCQHFECTKSDWQEVKKRAPERDLNFFQSYTDWQVVQDLLLQKSPTLGWARQEPSLHLSVSVLNVRIVGTDRFSWQASFSLLLTLSVLSLTSSLLFQRLMRVRWWHDHGVIMVRFFKPSSESFSLLF